MNLIEKLQSKSFKDVPDPSYNMVPHSTVPNGSVSPARIVELYSQGQPLPSDVGAVRNSPVFRSVVQPTDTLDAIQRSKEFNSSLVRHYNSVISLPPPSDEGSTPSEG